LAKIKSPLRRFYFWIIISVMEKKNKIIRWLIGIAIVVFAVRMLSLGWTPLSDTTEARYAEIGRTMAETGNWTTPMIDEVRPFWAKPPLSFWATATSYKIFGENEFAAHFPHFLFLVGAAALAYFFVRARRSESEGGWRGQLESAVMLAIVATMFAFLYLAGGVMTDPALTFCVTLCMVAFYNAVVINKENLAVARKREGGWGYLFFAGLGLGLLAKGPLIFMLVGFPIFIWVLIENKWRDMFRAMPWIGGILLMLAVAAPWYILAERATPGFLRYFIIGEHFERYVTPNWAGDLYGAGRGGFMGRIWLFYIICALPWSLWFAIKMFGRRFRRALAASKFFHDEFLFYIFTFAIATPIFFTFARNTVMAYALPMLIPVAILLSAAIAATENGAPDLRKFKWFGGLAIAACVGVIALESAYPKWTAALGISDKYLVMQYEKSRNDKNAPLFYFGARTYSSEFYSDGKIIPISGGADLLPNQYLQKFVIIKPRDLDAIAAVGLKITPVASGKKTMLITAE